MHFKFLLSLLPPLFLFACSFSPQDFHLLPYFTHGLLDGAGVCVFIYLITLFLLRGDGLIYFIMLLMDLILSSLLILGPFLSPRLTTHWNTCSSPTVKRSSPQLLPLFQEKNWAKSSVLFLTPKSCILFLHSHYQLNKNNNGDE